MGNTANAERKTCLAPLETPVFVYGSQNTEGNSLPPPETYDDRTGKYTEDDPFSLFCESTRREDEVVDQVSQHEYGKV